MRFPLLNVYRWLLQLLAFVTLGLTITVAVVIGMEEDANPLPRAALVAVGGVGMVFAWLVGAELIKLFLNIEDHLYHIRWDQLSPTLASEKAQPPPSSEVPEQPQEDPHTDKEAAGLLFSNGYEAFRKGDLQAALRLFNQAIKLDPNNPVNYTYRGYTYRELGQNDRAESDMETARQLEG